MRQSTLGALGFVNTREFQPAANHFRKYGRYDDGEPESYYNIEYWTEEERRCLEGYTVGGLWIPGDYYFYLNYCKIQLISKVDSRRTTYGQVHDTNAKHARKVGRRHEDFPAFWDVDFMYFRSVDVASNGISDEEYKKLPIELNIMPWDRHGGRHFIWLKPRGVGASWKGASKPLKNFSLLEDSKSYMMANEKEYLTKDGIWSKFHDLNNWLLGTNPNTGYSNALGIGKISDFKKDMNNMHIRASFKFNDREEGMMSEVFGVTLKNNWQKARGKRGQLILWEELGKFPHADLAWEVARPSVEEGETTFGTMIGFGTGGTEGADFEAIKNMFYEPEQYNILCFDNIFDEGRAGDSCAFFTPAYRNIDFIDKEGNSLQDLAMSYFDVEREKAKKSKDPTLLARKMAENPFTPKEAVLETGSNPFLSDALLRHREWVDKNRLYQTMGTKGLFERVGSSIKFFHKPDIIPIDLWPHKNKYSDTSGATQIYQEPFKINGNIPKNLYKLCLDTYRHDHTTGDSLGAAYVIEQGNTFTATKGDIIVGSYVGRPNTQDDFNAQVFLLAQYFNAEIAFENDEPGDVVGYAKKNKLTWLLAEEFELAFDETLKTSSSSKRGFGMHMGSGKDDKRRRQGDLFLKYWLYTVRRRSEDGTEVLNLHTIYDLALLDELIGYNSTKNCDRVSALRVGMYHMQELMYNEIIPKVPTTVGPKRNFFNKKLYV